MIINTSGGGGGLNFEIAGGASEPTNPKENTIWVNTSEEITGWVLSPEAPASPAEGMVWIRTGESGKTAFNVLKKENIMVNPIRCDQYINGVWTAKSTSIYQAGEWKPFQKRLYWLGSLATELVLTNNYYASLVEGTDSLSFTDTNDMAERQRCGTL